MSYLVPREMVERALSPLISLLLRGHVHPNIVSLVGGMGNVGAGVLVARGEGLAGGILMWAASLFDLLDGALARATGRQSPFGSIWDAVLDRASEGAVLCGLLFHFSQGGDREGLLLAFVAAVSSFMVSYIRARSEIVGVRLTEGIMARPERVFLLGLGLIIDHVKVMLWALVILASLTIVQRLFLAWIRIGAREERR